MPVVATPQNDVLAAFIQDRWQILSNLTVNAGVRWEKQMIRGLDNITYIDIDHFSPRVGFTWDFLNNGKTKAYASYSQFVPLIPMDMNVRSLNLERDGFTTNFDPVALPCASDFFSDEDCNIRGEAVDDVDPNLKSPVLGGDPGRVSSGRSRIRGSSAFAASTGRSGGSSRTPAFRWTCATTTRSSIRDRACWRPGFRPESGTSAASR